LFGDSRYGLTTSAPFPPQIPVYLSRERLFNGPVLRFAEEIILLALDEKTGRLHPLPERALEFALAGAVLAELAAAHRIVTDATTLTVKDFSPTSDPLLDEALHFLPKDEPTMTLQKALARIALQADKLKPLLYADLVQKGILQQQDKKFLWALRERRYPTIDDREEREARARIRDIVLNPAAVPSPQDVVLIGLMDACDLDIFIFTPEELERSAERIKQISSQDSIVAALTRAIGEMQQAILDVIAYSGM
jgi:golgi phosphoprotein 3